MSKMNKVVYFVEGECEEKLINALKQEPSAICPGKVKKINVIQNVLSTSQLIQIQTGTIVVLVFDTDVPQTDCLKKNLKLLEKKAESKVGEKSSVSAKKPAAKKPAAKKPAAKKEADK